MIGVAKRLAFAGAFVAAFFVFGSAAPASADNGPHIAGAGVVADGCAGCHRVHTAKAGKLLKSPQATLCYSCHGTAGTGARTDVQGGTGYAAANRALKAGALRGGGFEFALINSGASGVGGGTVGVLPLTAPAATTSNHSINGSSQMAWGNGAISATADYGKSVTLSCGSCHDPHGNGNYRILKPVPTDSGGTSTPIADSAAGVAKVYTTANYWSVGDAAAPAYIANVSAWCTTCHTRYLAPTGSGSTSSTDAVFTYRHISNGTTNGGASCIKCHVSHGSNAAMGAFSGAVGTPDGVAATAGNSKLLRIDSRGVCQQCHDK